MIQDLSIRSVETACAISGQAFKIGDRVVSFLHVGESGEIERKDCMESAVSEDSLPAQPICRWSQVYRDRSDGEAANRRAALQTAEEVFLHLIDEPPVDDPAVMESRARLKFLLALQLERKRILRAAGTGSYLHIKSKRHIRVEELPLTADLLKAIQADTIQHL